MTAQTTSDAHITTEHASRYLQQLCKHWSHRFAETTFDAAHGVVPFGEATCTFDASSDALRLHLEAAPEQIARMEEVVAKHLERFAFRETLDIRWTRSPA